MPVSHLEDEWQGLFKGIQLYITSEGRYDKLMLYHFNLLDHFTGKTLLNLPFFFHKSLTKVCKKIRAEPLSMKNTLCHFGPDQIDNSGGTKTKRKDLETFSFLGRL
jgi:hypothetical protein